MNSKCVYWLWSRSSRELSLRAKFLQRIYFWYPAVPEWNGRSHMFPLTGNAVSEDASVQAVHLIIEKCDDWISPWFSKISSYLDSLLETIQLRSIFEFEWGNSSLCQRFLIEFSQHAKYSYAYVSKSSTANAVIHASVSGAWKIVSYSRSSSETSAVFV